MPTAGVDYVTDGKIGVDLTATYASTSVGSSSFPPYTLGETVTTSNNGRYMFTKAISTINQYDCVIGGPYGDSASSSPNIGFVPITTTNAAAQGFNIIGFAQVAIASAYWGWICLNGSPRVNLLIACNPKVPLYTTATAGSLDDTTVSAGLIQGLVANTSATSASAPYCTASYPHLQIVGAG